MVVVLLVILVSNVAVAADSEKVVQSWLSQRALDERVLVFVWFHFGGALSSGIAGLVIVR